MTTIDPTETPCMGRGCNKAAEVKVTGLVLGVAITRYPVVLCVACLRRGENAVDFMKWAAVLDDQEAKAERAQERQLAKLATTKGHI